MMKFAPTTVFVAVLVSGCTSSEPIENPGGKADEASDLLMDQLTTLVTEDVIVNADVQEMAEFEVSVHQDKKITQDTAGDVLVGLMKKHILDDEFGSTTLGDGFGANTTTLHSGGGACDGAKETLLSWLTDEGDTKGKVSAIIENDDLLPFFCAEFLLGGDDQASQFVLYGASQRHPETDELISRALVVEATGNN